MEINNIIKQQSFTEITSKYDFEKSVNIFVEKAEHKSWKVFNIYDLEQKLKSFSKNILPLKVVSLCKPEISSKVVSKDSGRIYSALMPCRVSIYKKENGDTHISVLKMSSLVVGAEADIVSSIMEADKEIYDILMEMI
jgi:uncharacterized protein (DUF302 family)